MMRFHFLVIFPLLLISLAATGDNALWVKLQQEPNLVVLMRNTESTGNRDGANMLVWDASGNCRGESTLTEAGRAHAGKIGEAFVQHGIRPKVISSPMCRCRETAEIAFGDFVTDADLRQTAGGDEQGHEAFLNKTAELLRSNRGGKPIVFVNHRPNIDALTMELLHIGDLLVGTVDEDGEIEIMGKIRVAP